MQNDLQKASFWKRIAAGIFDLILVATLATGFGWLLSSVLNYNSYSGKLEQIYTQYAAEYNINSSITEEEFNAMTPEEQAAYEAAVLAADEAINADEEAVHTYSMVLNLSLIIVTGGILLSMLLLEFVLPLILGNGQTVGKKIFSLCLVRNDGVKLNNLQLFTRMLLGKFAVETMIPVYVILMWFLGSVDMLLILLVAALLIAQCIIMAVTRTNALLHDLMAGTVVVDHSSQRIFKSTGDLIAYQKKLAAERAARQEY